METNQPQKPTTEEMLMQIYENTRQTKNYMKWQLYITVVLVVLPLLAMVFIVPMVLRSVGNAYGGLLQ